MQDDIAIRIENLSKAYKLYDKPFDRLKESLNPLGKSYHRDFYALRDVSFTVRRGETVGIIGKNGSGKSTLLKIITGVVTPTAGEIGVNGKISALLELGAGFNPEFTGVENIYMNGMVMGYSTDQVDEKLDEIIAFADIGDFIRQPVKMYSSGMFVRLAFAVNACIHPEIFIVDEALSVGDAFFQNKCFNKFQEIRKLNTPILFVSHDLDSVKRFCDKVLWLSEGKMMMFGGKDEVCSAYLTHQFETMNREQSTLTRDFLLEPLQVERAGELVAFPALSNMPGLENKMSSDAELMSFFILDEEGERTTRLSVDHRYTVHIVGRFHTAVENGILGFVMENAKGVQVLSFNTYISTGKAVSAEAGMVVEAAFAIMLPRIMRGTYFLSPAIASGNQFHHVMLTWLHNVLQVEVSNSGFNLSILELPAELRVHSYDAARVTFHA